MKVLTYKFYGLLFLTALLASCEPDDIWGPDDPHPRDKYIGSWMVQESGKKKSTYEVVITASANDTNQVLINNFYNFGISPYANIDQSSIEIPLQAFPQYSVTVWGLGSYYNNKISWVYYVNTGADLDTIHSTYTKQ